MKSFLQNLLAKISKAVLRKYKPVVIGITGSVGKTSAKEAIFAVVSERFNSRTNIKNYNNEFGLPFTILGVDSPKRNPFKWLALFLRSIWLLAAHQEYPEVLVLEMGIDRPGDMDHLVEIANPDIGVLTSIGISHYQYFKSHDSVLREKKKIFQNFGPGNTAILNYDDARIQSIMPELKSKVITYGKNPGAKLRIVNHRTVYSTSRKSYGTEFELDWHSEVIHSFLRSHAGLPHVRACAAAAAVGEALGMAISEIKNGLENYKPQPGRMALLHGLHNSIIIDDTYNSAPDSAKAALEELKDFPAVHKIAVLGDMLELGGLSQESHAEIGRALSGVGADFIVLVGPESKATLLELKSAGFHSDRIFWFAKSLEAVSTIKNLLSQNHKSAILIKGSQGMRMEKIVSQILAEPNQAPKLLCRQDLDWLKK